MSGSKRLIKQLLVGTLAWSLVACTGIDLSNPVARRNIVAVGAVTVNVPETFGQVRAIDISTLGVGADTSVFVGWRRGQFVFVQPGECQLLIIIRSAVEVEHAQEILRTLEGGRTCMVDFAGSVRPSR